MADKPETLEETQARLARVPQGTTTPLPPPGSSPVSPPPGTPYGPTPPAAPDFSPVGGSGDLGTMRPDPYAATAFPQAGVPLAPTPTKRPFAIAGIVFGAIAVVVIAAVVAVFALSYSDSSDGDPFTGGDEPEYSEEWQEFPGVSYVDPNDTLAQPSYEEVAAGLDTLLTQYRDELTAEFGFTWSQTYEGYSDVESNGYGGDSMLYYVDTGSWQGQVQLDDPAARQTVFDLFSDLSAAHGGEEVLLRNEIYADDPESSRDQFGAEKLEDQALWSFFNEFPSLAGGYLSGDVFDRNIPVADSFTGDYMFTFDESSATLYVTIYGYADGLLKEGDRAAFEEALKPYNGDYEP